jgi:hypothetical protein
MTFNGDRVNGDWPLMFLGAPRNIGVCRTALHAAPTSNILRGTNRKGRYHSLSGFNTRQSSHLLASHRSVKKEECSGGGHAGSPPEQQALSLRQERNPAI